MAVEPADAPAPAPTSPPPSTRQPLYDASTQFSHWRFSPEQLAHTRYSLNAAAVAAIRRTFETDSAHQPGSSSNIDFLSAEEEQLLVKLYIGKVTQLCGHFRFPEEVEATAVSYLKRFYLKNTVMDWHPKNVMLTALFLATKTTNNPISIEAYTTAIPKTAPTDVLDVEFLVAQSLNFEFVVWHAHRALWGLWLDVQSVPDTSQRVTREEYDAALGYVRASRLTDAELVYTPSQIALACMHMASPTIATQWASWKGNDAVLGVMPGIQEMIRGQGTVPSVDDRMRQIDRRLKSCTNPEKVVGSKAYMAAQEKKAKKAEAKRARKAQASNKAEAEGDPFGQQLAEQAGAVDPDDEDEDDEDD